MTPAQAARLHARAAAGPVRGDDRRDRLVPRTLRDRARVRRAGPRRTARLHRSARGLGPRPAGVRARRTARRRGHPCVPRQPRGGRRRGPCRARAGLQRRPRGPRRRGRARSTCSTSTARTATPRRSPTSRDWGARVVPGGRMLVHDSFSSIGVTLAILRQPRRVTRPGATPAGTGHWASGSARGRRCRACPTRRQRRPAGVAAPVVRAQRRREGAHRGPTAAPRPSARARARRRSLALLT